MEIKAKLSASLMCADLLNLERDIRDRLDWYLDSGFTAIWVWSVDLGGGNHEIFIGYA